MVIRVKVPVEQAVKCLRQITTMEMVEVVVSLTQVREVAAGMEPLVQTVGSKAALEGKEDRLLVMLL